jgi:translation initiation factor 2 subunit 1
MVLRVDKEKGYIDLSKRRVDPDGIKACEDRYNKAKAVHRALRQVADKKGLVLKQLYKEVGWPLYKKYGHCYDAFRLVLTDQVQEKKGEYPAAELSLYRFLQDYVRCMVLFEVIWSSLLSPFN